MATISSSIELIDKVSRPLKTISTGLIGVANKFDALSNKNVVPSTIETLQNEVSETTAKAKILENALNKVGNTQTLTEGQDNFNNSVKKSIGLVEKLKSSIAGALGVYAILTAGKKIIGLSDEMTSIDARLNLIVDGENAKANLKNAIYQASQDARVPMNEFASGVAKLGMSAGDKFRNNDEIVSFMNTVSKSFKLAGVSSQEASSAMYQLNQAMAAGKLQGDEFRSITENAPMLAQAISKSMGVSQAELKKLGSEGKITADVIKKAVFDMAGDVDEKFKGLPKTWSDVWVNMKNQGKIALEPILKGINRLANSKAFNTFVNNIMIGFKLIADIGGKVFDGLAVAGEFIAKNWGFIEPLFIGIASAILYYATMQGIATIQTGLSSLATVMHTGALFGQMVQEYLTIAATEGLTVAQTTLNAAMYSFPGTWIVAAIVGIIVVIISLIAWIVKSATNTKSWGATIIGILYVVGAVFYNIISSMVLTAGTGLATIWNAFAAVGNFIANVLRDPATSFIRFIIDMVSGALKLLAGFTGVVDNIIGTNFKGKLENASTVVQKVSGTIKTQSGNNYKEVFKQKTAKDFGMDFGRKEYGKSYDKGVQKVESWKGAFDKLKGEIGGKDKPTQELINKDGNDLKNNTKDTANNTGRMADGLEDTEEELKYLREVAEQEHINKFTTAEIKVDMSNNNTIEKDADIDSIVRKLTEKLEEQLTITAQGVY